MISGLPILVVEINSIVTDYDPISGLAGLCICRSYYISRVITGTSEAF